MSFSFLSSQNRSNGYTWYFHAYHKHCWRTCSSCIFAQMVNTGSDQVYLEAKCLNTLVDNFKKMFTCSGLATVAFFCPPSSGILSVSGPCETCEWSPQPFTSKIFSMKLKINESQFYPLSKSLILSVFEKLGNISTKPDLAWFVVMPHFT